MGRRRATGRGLLITVSVVVLAACGGSAAPVAHLDAGGPDASGAAGMPSTSPSVTAVALEATQPSTPVPEPTPGPTAAATTTRLGPVATPAQAAIEVPEAGILPRTMSYGMLAWTVVDAAITDQDPRSYVVGTAGTAVATPSLIVDFQVANADPHVGFLSTAARLIAVLGDGTSVDGKLVAGASLPPASTAATRYGFAVPAGTSFDGLLLRFVDPGKEPSVDLPLSGPAPDVERDRSIAPKLASNLAIPGVHMRWSIRTILVGRDWPLPIGFKGGTLVPGPRARTGHLWVGIVARVDVTRCDCKGGVYDQSQTARLLVGGLPYSAEATLSSRPIMVAQTFADVMLVFDVPSPPATAVLQVGPLEKPAQQTTFTIPLR
jgi:hypothetical protein